MKNEALLIIDMLNDFVRPGAPLEVPDARMMIPVLRREIDRARTAGMPILYLCDNHVRNDKEFTRFGWPEHAVQGTRGAEVVAELKPAPSDITILKDSYSAFFGTRLDEVLKKLHVDSLRITGCVTNICVLFTTADAVQRGYTITIVEDGVAGLAKEDHDAALRIMKNVLKAALVKSGTNAADIKAA